MMNNKEADKLDGRVLFYVILLFVFIVSGLSFFLAQSINQSKTDNFCKSEGFDEVNNEGYCVTCINCGLVRNQIAKISDKKASCDWFFDGLESCHWVQEPEIVKVGEER